MWTLFIRTSIVWQYFIRSSNAKYAPFTFTPPNTPYSCDMKHERPFASPYAPYSPAPSSHLLLGCGREVGDVDASNCHSHMIVHQTRTLELPMHEHSQAVRMESWPQAHESHRQFQMPSRYLSGGLLIPVVIFENWKKRSRMSWVVSSPREYTSRQCR